MSRSSAIELCTSLRVVTSRSRRGLKLRGLCSSKRRAPLSQDPELFSVQVFYYDSEERDYAEVALADQVLSCILENKLIRLIVHEHLAPYQTCPERMLGLCCVKVNIPNPDAYTPELQLYRHQTHSSPRWRYMLLFYPFLCFRTFYRNEPIILASDTKQPFPTVLSSNHMHCRSTDNEFPILVHFLTPGRSLV